MARTALAGAIAALTSNTSNHVDRCLARCITPFPADVRIWGSSLVQLNPRPSPLLIRKILQAFTRRFKRVTLVANGRKVYANGIQLSSLRPQLAGGDLFIAAPQQSGKTLLYLLPEAIRRSYIKSGDVDKAAHKTLVLLPTVDLVLLGSRNAAGVLRQTCSVLALYYKDVLSGQHKSLIPRSDVIYTTPQCALKAMLATPALFEDVKTLVLDEAQRLLKAQSLSTVLRLKALLKPHIQTIVLAPRNDNILRERVSRALRVDMKVISFCPEHDGSPVTRHIWGPQRSAFFDVVMKSNANVNTPILPMPAIEQKAQEHKKRIVDHCRTKELFIDHRYRCEFVLYDPSKLCQMIHATLTKGAKAVFFYPTVRMAQFCYIYFKHCLKVKRPMYALHGGLSQEKRRYTIDVFSSVDDGVLFCTDIASLGLNLGDVDFVAHVGAPESVEVLADRVGMVKTKEYECSNLLLLHDLDAHVLYEASQLNCDIQPTKCSPDQSTKFDVPRSWVDNPCYSASCELMYRSLLGYYCNHAMRLKFERWQVPSLVCEIVRSFGCTDTFSVSHQFASRLQLWDAPGLVIDRQSKRKTELQAAAAGYPGFKSRAIQTNTTQVDELYRTPLPIMDVANSRDSLIDAPTATACQEA
ncbi:RNA helicase, putative [Babesia bigemina]|uniref:ATP-dependent RNA helicase n=1 Tax=Babesia bigemina TaxID=5866 RepID=A0A061DA08_BABBI|nr:RNA helicase, putative [Babesia bigemina]CDR97551.1 RNA helicase, putative [Babesia bigemina]|eukprot:XP_012769737.1 RNA helicase, putative [Babesia bigemina]